MKKKANRDNRGFIEKFCMAQENKARLSLMIAAAIVVVTIGSVCTASLALNSDTIYPSENVELDAAQDYLAQAAIEAGISNYVEMVDSSEFTEEETESSETMATKQGGLTGDHVIDVSDLKSLSDKDLVDAIVSGQAGVIAKSDIVIDQSQDSQNVHQGSEAAAPTPTPSPSVPPETVTMVNYELGIDVSGHNGNINWSKVKEAGITFAFIRCGGRGYGAEGNIYEDTKFSTNVSNAKAAGIKVGVYFFSQAITAYEALEEASITLSKLGGMSLYLPVVLDWETGSGYRTYSLDSEIFSQVITAYCSTISQNGYTPMIYLDGSNIKRLGSYQGEIFSKYKLWYAYPYSCYSDGSMYKAGDTVPPRSYSYAYWQYSWHGNVPGISTDVDLDLRILGSITLSTPEINLPSQTATSGVGQAFDPLNGVTAKTSQGDTVTSNLSYEITDASGQVVSLDQAQKTLGTYTITYTYKDAFRGSVTAVVTWTVTDAAITPTDSSSNTSSSSSSSSSDTSSSSSSDSSSSSSSESSSESSDTSASDSTESSSSSSEESTSESTSAAT